ncbi:MAG: hypothetical protein RJQ08_00555 [Salinisphaeraceae bacterium]
MTRITHAGLAALALMLATAGHAQTEADKTDNTLGAEMLAGCAQRVQNLREESARLNRAADEFEQRRQALAEQHESIDGGDGVEASGRLLEYNKQAEAFNEDIAEFRDEVIAVNDTKQWYHDNCANRAYRRSDLEALPADQAAAMRAGLADVEVPYIE